MELCLVTCFQQLIRRNDKFKIPNNLSEIINQNRKWTWPVCENVSTNNRPVCACCVVDCCDAVSNRLSINRSKMFLSKTTRISLGRYSTNIKGTLTSDLYTFLRTKISKLEKSNFESTKCVQVCAHGGKFESDERWLRLRFAPLLVCSWLNAISDILTKLNHPVEWCKRIECLTGCLIVAGKNGVPLCVP